MSGNDWRVERLAILLCSGQPPVSFECMRDRITAVAVDQTCLRLPVQPSSVKGSVKVSTEIVCQHAASLKNTPSIRGSKSRCIGHCNWRVRCHLSVAYTFVKVASHALDQSL